VNRGTGSHGTWSAAVPIVFGINFLCAAAASNLEAKTDGGPAAPGTLVDEIAAIVTEHFYSPARLQEVDWGASVERARQAFAAANDPNARISALRKLLASLETSHTGYYPRTDPTYWQLSSLFEPVLQRACPKELTPGFPITRDDIGVFWKQVEGEWFAGGVFVGGPADKAVSLRIQRTRGGAPVAAVVTPQSTRPQEELRQATANSWRIIEHKGRRIAYIQIWSWATPEFQQVVLDAVLKSNAAAVDGFILDVRDGWGGAHGHYLGLFFRDVPLLESVARNGTKQPFDHQIRKPAVLLVNGGTRSGKETIAYGAKKHRLARLVGERTAGAYNFGRPFCLSDGSLLLLAAADARVDGERLEGRGVPPDIEVPFDFRYAAGQDVQLARALELLSGTR
jgi:carboxyl-terminal processing protease